MKAQIVTGAMFVIAVAVGVIAAFAVADYIADSQQRHYQKCVAAQKDTRVDLNCAERNLR